MLETIAIRANKKTYNTSTDRSRVTHEARPDRGCKIKTSPPAMQTCQHLQEEKNTKKVNSLQAKTQVTDIKKPAQNCLVLPDNQKDTITQKAKLPDPKNYPEDLTEISPDFKDMYKTNEDNNDSGYSTPHSSTTSNLGTIRKRLTKYALRFTPIQTKPVKN